MSAPTEPVELSVVVPVYNEEKSVESCIRHVAAYCRLKQISWEILVVDDGSTDQTSKVLSKIKRSEPDLPLRPLRYQPNRGKGCAVRTGVLQSNGRLILVTDVDLSSPIKESQYLIRALEDGADVAIGSRALRRPGADVQQSLRRRLAGRIFNGFVRLLALPNIHDSQCGFKCFKRESAIPLFEAQKTEGFIFDVEILYLAVKMDFKIAEVPVMWRQGADSRVRFWRDSLRMIAGLFKIKSLHR